MIWALALKPGQECTHEGLEEIHLSLASLECRPGKCQAGTDGSDLISYLLLKNGHTEHLLCTLEKGHSTQQNLDLVLQPRERVTFSVEGSGIVYVTGYSSGVPEDESEGEEEGILGRIEHEDLTPLHTVVKQEPEDDICWEQRDDEGGGVEDGQLDSATIYEAPDSPHFLEEDEQVSPDNEEDLEQLNQSSEPLEVAGEQDAVLIKQESEEVPPEDEDARNVEIQGEILGVNVHESDTAGGGVASRTRNAVQTTQAAGGTSDVLLKVTETEQNEDITENDHTPSGISLRTRNALNTSLSKDGAEDQLQMLDSHQNVDSAENDQMTSGISSRTRNVLKVPPSEHGAEDDIQMSDGQQNVDNAENDQMPPDCSPLVTNGQDRSPRDMIENRAVTSHPSKVLKRLSSVRRRYTNRNLKKCVNNPHDVLVCQTCGKRFSSKYHRMKHEKLHVLKNSYKCRFCDQKFWITAERNAHESVHIKDIYFRCQFCDKPFKTKSLLGDHENTHTGHRPYKCSLCYKAFASRANWYRHGKLHTGIRYDCKMCSKSYSTKYRLKEHENIHTGNRPYKCKYCEETFISEINIRYHEFMHGKDIKFKCQTCDKAFFYKRDLLRHNNYLHA